MAGKSLLPPGYPALLAQLKARVRAAQTKAALSANRELIRLYWDIGRAILRAQNQQGWGAKVVSRLAADLSREFPEMSGFSRANLLFMRAFAQAWAAPAIVLQPVRQMPAGDRSPAPSAPAAFVQQAAGQSSTSPPEPVASLPWGHNLLLLHKLDSPDDRIWYACPRRLLSQLRPLRPTGRFGRPLLPIRSCRPLADESPRRGIAHLGAAPRHPPPQTPLRQTSHQSHPRPGSQYCKGDICP